MAANVNAYINPCLLKVRFIFAALECFDDFRLVQRHFLNYGVPPSGAMTIHNIIYVFFLLLEEMTGRYDKVQPTIIFLVFVLGHAIKLNSSSVSL